MKKIFIFLSMALAMTWAACSGGTAADTKRAELPEDIAEAMMNAALAGDYKTMLSYDIDFCTADEAKQTQMLEEYASAGMREEFKGATATVLTRQEDPEAFYGNFSDGTYDDLVSVEIKQADGAVQTVPLTFVKREGKWYFRNGS